MTGDAAPLSPEALAALVEDVFGDRVRKITRPGGASRPVYRVWLKRQTVIAAFRDDPAAAEKERMILSRLGPVCPHVPTYLGSRRGFTFQSDAGQDRLTVRIRAVSGADRFRLAEAAYASLFEIQHAAITAGLSSVLRPLDMDPDHVLHFARGPQRLAKMVGAEAPDTDWTDIARRITPARLRMTRSDCRAGNAVLDRDGPIGWFDYELAGLRHGAEDMGWLSADEAWPVEIETCCEIVETLAARYEGRAHTGFMDVFRLWTVLQMSRRLRLILSEASTSGWVPRKRVLRYDFVGTDPHLAARLADKAAWLARETAPARTWEPIFARTAEVFRRAVER